MIEMLVGAACFFTFFSVLPGIGTMMQASAVVLLMGAAGYAVIMGRVRQIPLCLPEWVMYVAGIAYVVLAIFSAEDSIGISVAFLATIVFMSVICRSLPLDRFLDIGGVVALLCVATALAHDRADAMVALQTSSGPAGLSRFMPLNNTPNLAGYIFGAGAILLFRQALVAKRPWERFAMGGGALLACIFVLAASARSSLVALAAAALVAAVFEIGLGRLLSMVWVRVGIVLFTIVALVFNEKLLGYLARILELDSSTRGLASGGSGRTNLWAMGIATLLEDPGTFVFGGGFRSSSADVIGFSTESSYITILLDSGIFMGTAVILMFLIAPFMALKLTPPQDRPTSRLLLLPAFMIFLVIESIFNRYLLAIGNPTSLLSLLLLFSVWMRRHWLDEPVAPRSEPAAVDHKVTS
jgi:exopolysaccharide production protein ExoQ